ncbi:MAG: trigger factor [Chloroflexi bacterium]|nr:trigger factor [Chloroflexota bacterium]
MKVTAERTPDSQVVLSFEAEAADLERSMEKAYKRLSEKASIPGFRKGNIPRVVIDRYLGRETVLEEAVNIMVPEATNKAIEEKSIEIIARPTVEVLGVEPVHWKATVPVRPTVELGDYRSIRVEPVKPEVTEEQISSVLEELRFSLTPWQPVERSVQFGDLLTIDVSGKDGEKTVADQKGAQYRPSEGLPVPVPGFAEQLVSMTKGQTKEFTLSYPADDKDKDLAGKMLRFTVALHEIKGKNLPEINDDFAKSVGDGYASLAVLKEKVAQDLKARAEAAAKAEFQDKAFKELVKMASVQFPPVLVENEIEMMLADQEEQLKRNKISLSDYLKAVDKTADQLREDLRPAATDRVTSSLVLSKFIQEEKVTVVEAEVSAEVERMVKAAGEQGAQVRQVFSRPEARHSIEHTLVNQKALDKLAAIARGESPSGLILPSQAPAQPQASGSGLWVPGQPQA